LSYKTLISASKLRTLSKNHFKTIELLKTSSVAKIILSVPYLVIEDFWFFFILPVLGPVENADRRNGDDINPI
jgi:hypothetical protein